MTGTILDTIVRDVRARIADDPSMTSGSGDALLPTRSLVGSIRSISEAGRLAVVAEHKRRSPSLGAIAADVDTEALVSAYEAAGAAGISVLTEQDHFGGSLADLRTVRGVTRDVPLLCKDFIVEAGQLRAARAAGADVVLLIAALHTVESLGAFVADAHALGLEVLAEVHDEGELEMVLATDADLVGVNARDLRSFEVDLGIVERLAPRVGGARPLVAESGIHGPDDAARVRSAGADAVLVGELLMRSADPARAIAALMEGAR